jgi:transposase
VRQKEVKTDPQVIADFVEDNEYSILCLESGSISHFLAKSLQALGFEIVMADARHMAGFLASRVNKNDKNDAYYLSTKQRSFSYKLRSILWGKYNEPTDISR